MSLYYVCECTMDWSTGVHSGSPMYLLAPRFPSGWCRYTVNLPPSLTHTYAHSFLISLRVLQPVSCSLRKGIWNELPQHPKEREREREMRWGREGGVVGAIGVRDHPSFPGCAVAATSHLVRGEEEWRRKANRITCQRKTLGERRCCCHQPLPALFGWSAALLLLL